MSLWLLLAAAAAGAPDSAAIDGPQWVEIAVAIQTDADPSGSGGLNAVTAAAIHEVLVAEPACAGICSARASSNGILIRSGAEPSRLAEELERIGAALTARDVDDGTVDRAVRKVSEARARLHANDRVLAYHELFRVLFEGTSGATNPYGSPSTLAQTSRSDVVANLRRAAARKRTRIELAGAVPDDAAAMVDRTLAALPAGTLRTLTSSATKSSSSRLRVVVVDKPDRRRAEAVVGWACGDTPASAVAAMAFGGLRNASLPRAVRGRVPEAFATARVVARRAFRAGVIEIAAPQNEVAAAIDAALAERRTLAQRGLGANAAAAAQKRTEALAAIDDRDAAAIVETRARAWLDGAPPRASSAAQLQTAARELVKPADLVVVVVASATGRLLEKLAALPGVDDVRVVAYDTR